LFIYLIVNHITGKYYIGQHKGNSLQKYLHQKLWAAEHGIGGHSRLYASIRKHGRNAFSIHALRSDIQTREELDAIEKDFIAFLRSQDPEYGYNLCRGGEGFTGPHTEETRARMADPRFRARLSEALRRAWTDPEVSLKHSKSAKKSWSNPEVRKRTVQKRWSPEARDRQSKFNRERYSTPESRVNQAESAKRAWSSIGLRTKQSELVKRLWSTPETRLKMLEGVKKRTASSRLGGKISGRISVESGMIAKAGCQRWRINRGRPCICGFHSSPKALSVPLSGQALL